MKFFLAKNTGKLTTPVLKRFGFDYVCSGKGELRETHDFGSWLIGLELQRRGSFVPSFTASKNHIAIIPSFLIRLINELESRLNPSSVKQTTSKRESYSCAS